jgi:hypothetical protein
LPGYQLLWLGFLWCPLVPSGRQALKLCFPSFPVHNSVFILPFDVKS